MNKKSYLGDGVYAEVVDDGFQIQLTVEDGISVTNVIYLEPQVVTALLRFIKHECPHFIPEPVEWPA